MFAPLFAVDLIAEDLALALRDGHGLATRARTALDAYGRHRSVDWLLDYRPVPGNRGASPALERTPEAE